MSKNIKIAIIHDFLKEYGGAERVVEAMHEIWPEAPVYTSFVDYKSLGPHANRIKTWNIIQSRFGSTWLMRKFHSPLRFLAPWVWKGFNLSEYDVVISSSGWYISRGVAVKKPTVHICYLHHPPRHLYGYATAQDWQKHWIVRVYATVVNHFLRMYDFETAQKVDYFIANSKETQRRITKFYRRESEVLYPPVTIHENIKTLKHENKIQNTKYNIPNTYFMTVSRLARAKHIDLLIEACQKMGENLVIVGKGREEKYLITNYQLPITKPNFQIKLLGEVSDEELDTLYQGAKAFLFAGEDEEFGIAPVEAMAHGIPIIGYRSGGIPETVIDGKTGVLFDELSVSSIIQGIQNLNDIYQLSPKQKEIVRKACIKQANTFSKEVFKREMRNYIKNKI